MTSLAEFQFNFMRNHLLFIGDKFIKDENGQGVTEYGVVLAFVAMMVAMVFGFSNGSLMQAVQDAFASLTNSVNNVAAASSN